MPKIRYDVSTGAVNLITTGEEELPVKGCKYMAVKTYPEFDHDKENLYVRGGKVVAVTTAADGAEQVRPVT
jgi:hypothetical protein